MPPTQPQAMAYSALNGGPLGGALGYILYVCEWNFRRYQMLTGKFLCRLGGSWVSAGAAVAEVRLPPMASKMSTINPRAAARSELDTLLSEISGWDNTILIHMYKRFATSRLFRVRHDMSAPMTEHAICLREAAKAEIQRRGLALPDEQNDK